MRRRNRLLVIALALLAPAAAYAQSMGSGAGTPDVPMFYPRGGATSPGLDFIFSSNAGTALWYQNGVLACVSAATCLTTTRATTNGSATDLLPTAPSGQTITTFADNTARISSALGGLLVEEARVNQLLNATAPVTQTTASLGTGTYTLWVNGSGSATMSAGTGTGCGTGAATQGTPVNFTITVAGTCTVTVAGSLNAFQLELGAFGTSLCTSGASACSRGADVVAATTGPAFGSSFTMLLSATPQSPTTNATNQQSLNISDGTNTNRANIIRAANTGIGNTAFSGTGGTTQSLAFNGVLSAAPTLTQGVNFKGAQSLTGASGMTTVNIGDRPDGALQWDGTIQRVTVWPTTALTATQVTTITK